MRASSGRRHGQRVGVSLAVLLLTLSACRDTAGNRSGVVVLVDFSKSFAPLTADDDGALGRVFESLAVTLNSGRLTAPTKVYATTIGNRSLAPPSPCGGALVYEPQLTGVRRNQIDAAQFVHSPAKLRGTLAACKDAVVALSRKNVDEFTDVSGALAMAQENLKEVRGERLLVVYSDFLEDLPPGQGPAPFRLNGMRIVMVWRPGLDDQKDLTGVLSRIASWRDRLLEAGALDVCTLAVPGLTVPDLASCLGGKQ